MKSALIFFSLTPVRPWTRKRAHLAKGQSSGSGSLLALRAGTL